MPAPAEPSELRSLLDLAEKAARSGGAVVLKGTPGPSAAAKGIGDYVTDVDRASEKTIAAVLSGERPDIPILGEETGGTTGPRYWTVDPLDGTTNYLHGFPLVGVSVCLIQGGRPAAGVVHAPFLRETYTGARELGATVDRGDGRLQRLSVSARGPQRAVVATGFPFRDKQRLPRYLTAFRRALERFEDLRRPGAASLDLAWVASGVFDGFFELGLSSWDVAAGALLVEEAGGTVSDWSGGGDYLAGDILAGPTDVHAVLLEIARGSAAS